MRVVLPSLSELHFAPASARHNNEFVLDGIDADAPRFKPSDIGEEVFAEVKASIRR